MIWGPLSKSRRPKKKGVTSPPYSLELLLPPFVQVSNDCEALCVARVSPLVHGTMQRRVAGQKRRLDTVDEPLTEQDLLFLTVVGYTVNKYPADSPAAIAINRGSHLVTVSETQSSVLRVDRYDVRATLSGSELLALAAAEFPPEDDEILDNERFRDLHIAMQRGKLVRRGEPIAYDKSLRPFIYCGTALKLRPLLGYI